MIQNYSIPKKKIKVNFARHANKARTGRKRNESLNKISFVKVRGNAEIREVSVSRMREKPFDTPMPLTSGKENNDGGG